MLADVIRGRLQSPEFHPFTIVLVNGERFTVTHRDSLAHPSTVVNGRRIYSPYLVLLESAGELVTTRSSRTRYGE